MRRIRLSAPAPPIASGAGEWRAAPEPKPTPARRTDSSSSSGSDSDSGCYSGGDSAIVTATWPPPGRRERGGLVVVSRSIDDLSEDDNLPQRFPECRGPTAAVSEASARYAICIVRGCVHSLHCIFFCVLYLRIECMYVCVCS
jgi:hypothetical protein